MGRYEFPLLLAFRLILYTTLIQSCAPLDSPLNGGNDITTHELVTSTLDNEDDTKASRIRRYGEITLFLSGAPLHSVHLRLRDAPSIPRPYSQQSVDAAVCGIEWTSPIFLFAAWW